MIVARSASSQTMVTLTLSTVAAACICVIAVALLRAVAGWLLTYRQWSRLPGPPSKGLMGHAYLMLDPKGMLVTGTCVRGFGPHTATAA